MFVHTRRITMTHRKPWAVVTTVGGRRQIIQRFRSEGGATRYLNNTWPNHDPSRIRVERVA